MKNKRPNYALLVAMLSGVVMLDIAFLALFASGALSSAITHTDFTSLLPNLFVALFTGVTVGLTLNYVQRRRLRHEMAYDFELARIQILDRISVLAFAPDFDDLGKLGPIAGLVDYLSRYPVGRWRRELKYPQFDTWIEAIRLLENLAPIGTHISRLVHARAGGTTSLDMERVAHGLILGLSDARIMGATKTSEPDYSARLKPIAEILIKDVNKDGSIDAYRARRERSLELMKELRGLPRVWLSPDL